MKVREAMTRQPFTCGPRATLVAAAELLAEGGCGLLPVLDDDRRVVGVITDRDVCLALAARAKSAAELSVSEFMSPVARTCGLDDDVHDALRQMRTHRVSRLPVLDADGVLSGVVSLTDLVLRAKPNHGRGSTELTYEDVMLALQAIAQQRQDGRPAAAAHRR